MLKVLLLYHIFVFTRRPLYNVSVCRASPPRAHTYCDHYVLIDNIHAVARTSIQIRFNSHCLLACVFARHMEWQAGPKMGLAGVECSAALTERRWPPYVRVGVGDPDTGPRRFSAARNYKYIQGCIYMRVCASRRGVRGTGIGTVQRRRRSSTSLTVQSPGSSASRTGRGACRVRMVDEDLQRSSSSGRSSGSDDAGAGSTGRPRRTHSQEIGRGSSLGRRPRTRPPTVRVRGGQAPRNA
ncbi:hypothetical protein BD414DRAFT_496089 [Trametes punicea]|nr:hypothetical protein BD414DRAFT_496089 [Trametes punicea]